jgi:hypothetical protein
MEITHPKLVPALIQTREQIRLPEAIWRQSTDLFKRGILWGGPGILESEISLPRAVRLV